MSNSVKEFCVCLITISDHASAVQLARKLVEAQLIACANIVPNITSVYSWKGKVEEDSEYLMIVKTRNSLQPKVTDFVKQNHPYEIPEVIFLDIQDGNLDYLNWVRQNTSKTE